MNSQLVVLLGDQVLWFNNLKIGATVKFKRTSLTRHQNNSWMDKFPYSEGPQSSNSHSLKHAYTHLFSLNGKSLRVNSIYKQEDKNLADITRNFLECKEHYKHIYNVKLVVWKIPPKSPFIETLIYMERVKLISTLWIVHPKPPKWNLSINV